MAGENTAIVTSVQRENMTFNGGYKGAGELVLYFRDVREVGYSQESYHDINYYAITFGWQLITDGYKYTCRAEEGSLSKEEKEALIKWIWQNENKLPGGREYKYYGMCGKFLLLQTSYYIGD